ncbi:hypothetical protein NDU88_004205 [Pleurodeles waltl]|uniref:Uncharacterized protein n=1 Tax=Pleurodeles waltl TaxID=8319 RepID=A0AAV7VJ56_PLEWA|nr:hypothetical protein NDU88_004205 [Pleurodeles waltl]
MLMANRPKALNRLCRFFGHTRPTERCVEQRNISVWSDSVSSRLFFLLLGASAALRTLQIGDKGGFGPFVRLPGFAGFISSLRRFRLVFVCAAWRRVTLFLMRGVGVLWWLLERPRFGTAWMSCGGCRGNLFVFVFLPEALRSLSSL